MSDHDPADLAVMTFEMLEGIRGQSDRMEGYTHDLKTRVGAAEYGLAMPKTDLAHQSQQIVTLGTRMDRFDDRSIWIEKRLDSIDA